MRDRTFFNTAAAALSVLLPATLSASANAAAVVPIVTVSNNGNADKLNLHTEYDFSINLNPVTNKFYYASANKVPSCGGERNPSGAYCAHDVTDKIIPESIAFPAVTLDGMDFIDGSFRNGVYSFSLGDNAPSTHELQFIETFSASRSTISYYYGNSNPKLDGYRTDIDAFFPNAPADFTGSPLSCSFSAKYTGIVNTTALCSFKFSFVAPEPGPPPLPASPVPEPATWMMLIAGFGLIGVAMRRRGPLTVRSIA